MKSQNVARFGNDVVVFTNLDPHLGRIKADPGQIDQVIMNLCVNARDTMPQGGSLTIEMSMIELDDSRCRDAPDLRPGQYVLLSVADTGSGMDQATQAKLFEPFFTTKAPGKGTGLGLSIVYGIVKQSNGHVTVISEVGQGTTFTIYLPQVEAPLTDGRTADLATAVDQKSGQEPVLSK